MPLAVCQQPVLVPFSLQGGMVGGERRRDENLRPAFLFKDFIYVCIVIHLKTVKEIHVTSV